MSTSAGIPRSAGAPVARRSTGSSQRSFPIFFASYMVIFLLAGMDNGSTYVVFAGVTWFVYMRKSFATERVPSLAYASV